MIVMSRALAPETLRLRRDQIHAAASALVECGTKPASIHSLAEPGISDRSLLEISSLAACVIRAAG
jgi:hypothetical protein